MPRLMFSARPSIYIIHILDIIFISALPITLTTMIYFRKAITMPKCHLLTEYWRMREIAIYAMPNARDYLLLSWHFIASAEFIRTRHMLHFHHALRGDIADRLR